MPKSLRSALSFHVARLALVFLVPLAVSSRTWATQETPPENQARPTAGFAQPWVLSLAQICRKELRLSTLVGQRQGRRAAGATLDIPAAGVCKPGVLKLSWEVSYDPSSKNARFETVSPDAPNVQSSPTNIQQILFDGPPFPTAIQATITLSDKTTIVIGPESFQEN